MVHETNLIWKSGIAFETELDGHKLTIDAGTQVGGHDTGMRPKKLMLTALAGCTGMDVVSILNKMKVEFDHFNVKVDGELTDEPPMYYKKMHITYEIKGKGVTEAKVKKAVELSQDKYCGVSALYKKAIEITYEIKILE